MILFGKAKIPALVIVLLLGCATTQKSVITESVEEQVPVVPDKIMSRTKANVILRDMPGLSADIVGKIPGHAVVEVLGLVDDYYWIRGEGKEGWVGSLFVAKTGAMEKMKTKWAEEAKPILEEIARRKAEKREKEQAERLRFLQEAEERKVRKAEEAKEAEERKVEEAKAAWAAKKKALTILYGEETTTRIMRKEIWLGMTKAIAIASWGYPGDINRTVSASGVREQFVYGSIRYRKYLYFDDGILTSWQD